MTRLYRVRFFIDGFNVYHSLHKKYRNFLWLNYKVLAEGLLRDDQILEGVYYFTAIAEWRAESAQRHRRYIRALEAEGVERVYGRFKKKDRYCKRCRRPFQGHEEKQTDVNIAIHMVSGAIKGDFDTACLVTNDTDLVPAINMVKREAPEVTVGVVFPLGRSSKELKMVADFAWYLKKKHLRTAQLADPYILSDGKQLTKPSRWK